MATKRYLEIHDWEDHQSEASHVWIRNYTKLLSNPRYMSLSCAQRGVLHGLWLYRGWTGCNPPVDPAWIRRILNVAPTKHMRRTIEVLIERGFLHETTLQKRKERKGKERNTGTGLAADADRAVSERSETPSEKPKPDRPKYPEDFEAWWKVYPNKTHKDEAYRRWKILKKQKRLPSLVVLTSAVKRLCASDKWQKDGGAYVPNPATWLNGGGWMDAGTKLPSGRQQRLSDDEEAEIDKELSELYKQECG